MRKTEHDDNNANKTFTLVTSIMEDSPLTAIPAKPYSFELSDEGGKLSDDEWYEKKTDEIPLQTLDPTSGNYLDRDIVAAMTSALTLLAKQRKEHLTIIKRSEEREVDVAEDISRALEDKLARLEAAKLRSAKFKTVSR